MSPAHLRDMTTTPARQPAGTSTGGQFAASVRAEADVSLTCQPDYDDIAAKRKTLIEAAFPADDPDGQIDVEAFRSAFKSSAIVGNAHRIYDYMTEHNVGQDSWTRELAFDYAAAETGRDYNELYDAWLHAEPVTSPCSECGTVVEVRLADATGSCSDCVGAYVREATKRRR